MSNSTNDSASTDAFSSSFSGCSISQSDDISAVQSIEDQLSAQRSEQNSLSPEQPESDSRPPGDSPAEPQPQDTSSATQIASDITENFDDSISGFFVEKARIPEIIAAKMSQLTNGIHTLSTSQSKTLQEESTDLQMVQPKEINIDDKDALFSQRIGKLQKRLIEALNRQFDGGALYQIQRFYAHSRFTVVFATLEGSTEVTTLVIKGQNFSGDYLLVQRSMQLSAASVESLRQSGYEAADVTLFCTDWETRFKG